MKKIKISLLLLIAILIAFVTFNYPRLNIISGYSAKNMSSSVFLAGRSLEITDTQDNNFSPIDLAKDEVDHKSKSVTASVYGFMKRKAIYREGLGSILMNDDFEGSTQFLVPHRTKSTSNLPYPYGNGAINDTVFANVNYDQLLMAINNAFDSEGVIAKKTRAVLVLYKDQLIAEKYTEGFDENSKILGWSMTKSVTSAIIGILEKQGKVTINQTNLFPEWEIDDRSKITLNNLLQMNSGLEWLEDYNTMSDVSKMLFLETDMTQSQKRKPLIGVPNNSWNYSSGTTVFLNRMAGNDGIATFLKLWRLLTATFVGERTARMK